MRRYFVVIAFFFVLGACSKNCALKTSREDIPAAGLAGEQKSEASAAEAQRPIISGKIVEVIQKDGFSYLRLTLKDGTESWFALVGQGGNVGDFVSIQEQAIMHDFESKSLKRTFPKITFGQIVKGD